MTTIERELQELEDQYGRAILKIAMREFHARVKPYCDKHKMQFYAGMGAYAFDSMRTKRDATDRIPKPLKAILDTSADQNGNCLGSYMVNYKPKDETP